MGILSDDNDIPVYTLTPGAKTNKTSWLEKDPGASWVTGNIWRAVNSGYRLS